MAVRVSLMDRISIEAGSVIVDEQRFPGRQGRLVLAYLLAARGRPVSRDELADALWADVPPARWEKALSVLVSKLRMVLNEAGIDGSESLTSAFGCYKLTLPAGTWIDVVAADEAAAAAARALAAGDLDAALINASTAASLARRTFLPGEEGRWVDDRRAELREILVRALECVSDAKRLSGDPTWAVRAAEELVLLDPFRESGYRRLMEAQSAAGNDAEALRTYERCRTLLADELGAYPSSETEAVYLEILRSAPRGSAPEVDQPEADGPSTTPPLALEVRVRSGRRRTVLVAVPFLSLAVAAAAVALVRASGGTASIPPKLLPNSVVRIDPSTLEPTEVVRVAPDPDLVVLAGGYVWVTNLAFRYTSSAALRNSGHRTLTRVDPATGDAVTVGGGLAPCGLVPDPSGDVWVANCYPARSGVHADVQRVDARTLALKQTFPVRAGAGYFRGLAYGGGSLWVADVSGVEDYHGITQIDLRTGAERRMSLDSHAGWLAWSDGYGDLWTNDFARDSVTRIHTANGARETFRFVGVNPASLVVDGDGVWVGGWANPEVIRLPAVGSSTQRDVFLPVKRSPAGVTMVAAGAGYIWATVPDSRALWRIDPTTGHVTRIGLKYVPWGVAVGDDGIWVAMRGTG